MRIGGRFIAARPGISYCSFTKRRKAVKGSLHYSLEEFPVNSSVKCWRFVTVAHPEQHASAFAMKIEAAAEIDHQGPSLRSLREWFCRPNEPPQRHNRNFNTSHFANRR